MSPRSQQGIGATPSPEPASEAAGGTTRRSFVGYVLAGATLVVSADFGAQALAPRKALAASPKVGRVAVEGGADVVPILSNPTVSSRYDFLDTMKDFSRPTAHLLKIEIKADGTAHFAMPRQEVGQGITTSFAQIIADELDMPFQDVKISLADARPELIALQITGGSTTTFSLWEPVRAAAALAKQRLSGAAAQQWGVDPSAVRTRQGVVLGPNGEMATYGSLTEAAASATTERHEVELKAVSGTAIGKSFGRVDARDAVTGKKKYTMDLAVSGALPTMICRAPTFNGTVKDVANMEQVKKMPGVTHVGVISSGVAVRARHFGQCIDAIRALKVSWTPGTMDKASNDNVTQQVAAAQLPMVPAPAGSEVVEETYTFHFRSGSPMETNDAIVDVRSDSAEIWGTFKCPIVTQQRAAAMLKMPEGAVTVHCITGGGSFGRHLYSDAAYEGVEASKLFGAPVKLMWHRADDSRHGRMHAMSVSHVRATIVGRSITSFSVRHAAAATDWTHGLGEIISASATAQDPEYGFSGNKEFGNLSVSAGFFQLETDVPYNFGPTDLALNEIFDYDSFPTSAVRNVYAPDVTVAREQLIEKLAKKFDLDGYQFRRAFLQDPQSIAVLDKVAEAGKWGRKMPAGHVQAIAFHKQYKGYVACLMEMDNTARTVNRKIPDAFTGPRITKVVMAVDVGIPVNPSSIKGQMMGGCMDGIAQALSAALHIEDGLPLEASWDNYRYTRQWNAPKSFECFVMPANRDFPGGAGELGIAVGQACAAIAHSKATGKHDTEFPVNFRAPLGFKVKSKTPPVPQSPTNGLRFAR